VLERWLGYVLAVAGFGWKNKALREVQVCPIEDWSTEQGLSTGPCEEMC